ncbi:hypothetical protein BDN72DRAFT_730312, partial [Pluteus cervinus]
AVRAAKRVFFDEKIAEISIQNKRPWDLMNWVRPRALRSFRTLVRPDGTACEDDRATFDALHAQYAKATGRPVDMTYVANMEQYAERDFPPFSKTEISEALAGTKNSSAPGPDHLSWK